MTKHLIQLILVCTVVLAAFSAQAEALRIVTVALPPYGYTENGNDTGLTYELCNLIAQEAGFEPRNRIVPLARAMEEIATGKADMVLMLPNQKINANARNLGLLLPMETIIIGRADSLYRSLKDVRGKRMATVRDAEYDDRITKQNGIILYPTKDYSQSLKMLLAGRVEAVIGPKLGLHFTAKANNFPKQAFGEPLVLSVAEGSVFISNKTSGDIAKRISAAVNQIKKNGSARKLMGKYSL